MVEKAKNNGENNKTNDGANNEVNNEENEDNSNSIYENFFHDKIKVENIKKINSKLSPTQLAEISNEIHNMIIKMKYANILEANDTANEFITQFHCLTNYLDTQSSNYKMPFLLYYVQYEFEAGSLKDLYLQAQEYENNLLNNNSSQKSQNMILEPDLEIKKEMNDNKNEIIIPKINQNITQININEQMMIEEENSENKKDENKESKSPQYNSQENEQNKKEEDSNNYIDLDKENI